MSKQKLPISVYIIAKDEELRLPRALNSVKGWVDEVVVVVDSKTEDKTAEIAKKSGAKVLFKDWEGYAVQKYYASQQCKNKWLLEIDADEWITDKLAAELKAMFVNGEPEHQCYNLKVMSLYPWQEKPCMFPHYFNIIRFYHKEYASIDPVDYSVDDRPKQTKGTLGQLKGAIYHHSIINLSHMIAKSNIYTDNQVKYNLNKGRNFSLFRLCYELPVSFFVFYILRKNILRGWYGFSLSIIMAFSRFSRIAKTREAFKIKENQS